MLLTVIITDGKTKKIGKIEKYFGNRFPNNQKAEPDPIE